MSITLPNLDDRRFDDLMAEARDLLVAHAPAMTNHNPSDPAITLIELFAWFTEVLLFRANTITAANRVKFLRLLNGPDWPVPTSPAEIDAQVKLTVAQLRRPDRAVTAADFEFLARASDAQGRIARAHCIPERNLDLTDPAARAAPVPAHVSVVLVPVKGADIAPLRTAAAAYLEPRRLLGSQVHVVGARSVPIRVQLTIRLMPDALIQSTRDAAVAALTAFFDPISGGEDGLGWPLGRNVYVSEGYRLLDGLPGVDYVHRTPGTTEDSQLDELATTAAFATRQVRNAANELISIALDPDELVTYDATTAAVDLGVELPPVNLGT